MKRYNVPRLVFINKLDRMGADPWNAINQVRDRLGVHSAAIQVNIGVENGLEGIVNLVNMKAYWFDGDSGEKIREGEIPAGLLALCKEKKLELIQSLAEIDEEMEGYFLEENIDVPIDVLKATIRKHTISLEFAPVLMGSAFKNKGV